MKRTYTFNCPGNANHEEKVRILLVVDGGERLGPAIAERIRKDFSNAHDSDTCRPRVVERSS
jgi:hypothetical protein